MTTGWGPGQVLRAARSAPAAVGVREDAPRLARALPATPLVDRHIIAKVATAWLLPLALLTGGVAVAQHAPEPIELSDEDDGRIYRVPVGAEFEVHLRGERGDDDRWEMRDDSRFIAVDPPTTQGYGNRRGDREDRTFAVRVTQPGRFPLVFEKLSTFGGRKRSLSRRVTFLIEAGPIEGATTASRGRDDSAMAGGAALPPLPPLHEADAGRPIHVPWGREIVILLPFASRLDQRWEVFASRNIGLTRRIVEQRDPDRKPNIFWLDSNAVIRLRPGSRGEAEVTFAYLPLSHGETRVRQLRYRFVVD